MNIGHSLFLVRYSFLFPKTYKAHYLEKKLRVLREKLEIKN